VLPISIFSQLCQKYNTIPEIDGEVYVPCPFCGKPSSRQHVHFSFCERGFKCFACGKSGSLAELAEFLDLASDNWNVIPIRRKRPRTYAWPRSASSIAARYHLNEKTHAAWLNYKQVSDEMLTQRMLGYGVFPRFSSRCNHERLIVPLICNGLVIGFRGRAIDCECGKWLSPGGSQMVLYNGARLLHPLARERLSKEYDLGDTTSGAWARSKILVITENPIDCIMMESYIGIQAVATLGVAMWRPEWTEILIKAKPRLTIIAYDADVVGNGGNVDAQAAWIAKHGNLPTPNGVRLRTQLQAQGLNVILWPWPSETPDKMDIGDVISEIRERAKSA